MTIRIHTHIHTERPRVYLRTEYDGGLTKILISSHSHHIEGSGVYLRPEYYGESTQMMTSSINHAICFLIFYCLGFNKTKNNLFKKQNITWFDLCRLEID